MAISLNEEAQKAKPKSAQADRDYRRMVRQQWLLPEPPSQDGHTSKKQSPQYPHPGDYGFREPSDSLKDWDSGKRFMTRSGVRVRSKIEKIIADYFHDRGILFIYEPPVELDGCLVRPDFYLPDYDLVHEHFGRTDADYRRSAESKLALYRQCNVTFSYTSAADEPDIEEVLSRRLAEAGVSL